MDRLGHSVESSCASQSYWIRKVRYGLLLLDKVYPSSHRKSPHPVSPADLGIHTACATCTTLLRARQVGKSNAASTDAPDVDNKHENAKDDRHTNYSCHETSAVKSAVFQKSQPASDGIIIIQSSTSTTELHPARRLLHPRLLIPS